MIKISPDVELPNETSIVIPGDIFNIIEENFQGLRYIRIDKFLSRGSYAQIFRLEINMNATCNSRPEEKPEIIAECISKCLQYYLDANDDSTKFKITCYKKTNKGSDKPITKHILLDRNPGEEQIKDFDPVKEEINLLNAQMAYILQLQDHLSNIVGIVPGIIGPLMEMNKDLQKNMMQIGLNNVEQARLEYQFQLLQQEKMENTKLELEKARISKEKTDNAFKMLKEAGALKAVIDIVKKKATQGSSETPPPQNEEKEEPEKEEENSNEGISKEEAEDIIRRNPTLIRCKHFDKHLSKEQREFAKTTLRSEVWSGFENLLKSETEQEAVENLGKLKELIISEDYEGLLEVHNKLDEMNQKIIQDLIMP